MLLIWFGLIAIIKIINVVLGFIRHRRLVAVHAVMNKVTGFLLFVFPLTFSFIEIEYSASIVCGAATVAAIQEGYLIGKEEPKV